tara:strand:+ start:482 stop:670 length:189 start_codon:yes stop_codon:yes gene_type:complete
MKRQDKRELIFVLVAILIATPLAIWFPSLGHKLFLMHFLVLLIMALIVLILISIAAIRELWL